MHKDILHLNLRDLKGIYASSLSRMPDSTSIDGLSLFSSNKGFS
jgi:hypothetical protein